MMDDETGMARKFSWGKCTNQQIKISLNFVSSLQVQCEIIEE